jgi:hypothetical protein
MGQCIFVYCREIEEDALSNIVVFAFPPIVYYNLYVFFQVVFKSSKQNTQVCVNGRSRRQEIYHEWRDGDLPPYT